MFDKHDVTTKKLDVIVEKAGKVDANYAAQIEGYCSLLGEYGKKFETVRVNFAIWGHIRISEIETEYCFNKDLERIVFMALCVAETMHFLYPMTIS